ncbi:MAG: SpoVR family protein [Chloroflexi bacterium]|nr:SpoVR family protein [Chloroflexota bacterium]
MSDNFDELLSAMDDIWGIAKKFGLDPFPTHFEVVPASIMYEFGAYGLPGRFSHWTHGKSYQQMKTMYDYGLSKIYELVINANPCYGFLMDTNSIMQNKLVVAHVLAHCDFFKNNVYFSHTSRQMIDGASINAERIRKYEFEHGTLEVEKFLDAVLSIQEHIDPNIRSRKRESVELGHKLQVKRAGPFDDLWSLEKSEEVEGPKNKLKRFPEEPEKDLLLFIAEHSVDLEEWQRDIIQIVRSEMLYFLPQMQTKIMNEGWASFWHARIMRELNLTDDEYAEFATLHSSVLAPSRHQINPYYIGMKMFEDIEKRWDEPTDEERERLGRKSGEGRTKIFEVRELENDVSFLRTYLTKQLVEDLDLYIYKLEGDKLVVVEKDWQKIRDMITNSMTNFGNPYIVVEDADYRRNRELYLKHSYEGQELDVNYAEKTMRYVYNLWGRAVHIETEVDGKKVVLTYDGEKSTKRLI